MEEIESLLKSSFAGAANQLTQLYVQSLQHQKHSFALGYNTALENIIQFISSTPNLSTEILQDYLKKEQTKYAPAPSSNSSDKNESITPLSSSVPSPTTPPPSCEQPSSPRDDLPIFSFQPPSSLIPPTGNTIDSIFTFVAQQPQHVKSNKPRVHSNNNTTNNIGHISSTSQQTQMDPTNRKRQIDLVFNPNSIGEVWTPMDQLLKRIRIDQ